MYKYIAKRLCLIGPVIILTISASFIVSRLLPGDPALNMLGPEASLEDYQRLREKLGLDEPLYVQFAIYFRLMIQGNWGTSLFYDVPAFDLILERLGATVLLATCSIALAFILGTLSGFVGVLKEEKTLVSLVFASFSYFSLSVPVFLLGLLLQLIFSVWLHIFPSMSDGGINISLVLPVVTLATWSYGQISRMTYASMKEVIDEDYVMTARAKGSPETTVLLRHVLRNALIPVVTLTSLNFGRLLAGAILTETVFSYPGLGRLLVISLFTRDYNLIQAGIFCTAIFFCFVNLATDILYAIIDPRVRYGKR